MDLFVIRHALAEDAAPGQDDATRALTKLGKRKMKDVVLGLRALELSFARVVTSPWTRALETARLLRPIASAAPLTSSLLCQPPRAELLSLISDGGETTAVVGHAPWLGELIAWLAFGDTRHGDAFALKKGGVVWMAGTAMPGGMQVCAVLPPKFLRALA